MNSEAENFMKSLTKAIRAAHVEKKNWKKELYAFLLNYRATPHTDKRNNDHSKEERKVYYSE